jgi:hypothetical protein
VSSISVEIAAYRLVEERVVEAVTLLTKSDHCSSLAAEACLRLARTHHQLNSGEYFRAFYGSSLSPPILPAGKLTEDWKSSAGRDAPSENET